ncbi:hypothetical protein J7M22_11155 [Candidatus Poribacteria bacterium]|nr:hypothetical protein [Candidatus Poribacteria bacterium]
MMRFSVLLVFSFVLGFYLTPLLFADRIFYDSFEDEAFTKSAWEKGEGNLHWELSTDYNHTPGGRTCIKLISKQMQVWEDIWHVIKEKPKPAHVRIWFYERGWKNKVKVDQQYLLIGDGTTDKDSANFCQIGQTGNPNYDGHYAIWNNTSWVKSKASSQEERWVKMEFVLYKDGTAKILIDDIEEYVFPQKWPHLGTIGLASYGRTDRGGVPNGYWDDIEVFDTEEAPALEVEPGGKLSLTWGEIKSHPL